MPRKSTLVSFLLSLIFTQISGATAATTSYNMSGKVVGGAGYSVLLVFKDGATKSIKLGNSGNFSFRKLKLNKMKGASLQLVDSNGRYAGAVVLGKKGSKVSTTFSGKINNAAGYTLGKIILNSGYATVKTKPNASVITRPNIPAVNGRPIGAGEYGLVQTVSAGAIRARATSESNPGADDDLDGIPNAFDVDDDGDLILDASDEDSHGLDIPYTNLVFDFRRTLNAHVRDGLTDDVIDDVVSSENTFSLTFFFSLPPESQVDGGYVVCDDALVYCRKDDPLGYYGGISESNDDFKNHPWNELLTSDGYPRMESINLSFGRAIVASIQPRVSGSQFRPGDVYQVRLTQGDAVASTRSLALAPYFVSIPAMKEYDAGFGTVQVDYDSVTPDSGSIPGMQGNPIVLSNSGLLTISFWRPQRAALRSDESGFYDWGNLNYGLVLDQAQATCGGLYSAVSGDLVEDSTPLGTGDSPFANQGANLSPLRDQQGDRAADAENTVSFTVDVKTCATRAGLGAGTYNFSLRAAGEEVTGGQVSAVQSISIQVP